ncbi:unnamed protein product [Orchesella dallaii]|uniref:Trehalase n=1 Tax=Orchesella dallaii TaxID=48710 RepID=A0ABP1Q4V7_9HEXA
MKNLLVPAILLLLIVGYAVAVYPQPCNDDIYCYGDILHTVTLAEPFDDRKTYVDLPLKNPRPVIKSNFQNMMANTSNNPSVDDVKRFLNENFGERGEELTSWDPVDWKPNPEFLNLIQDETLRQFGSELNALWKELGKVIKPEVRDNPDMFSLVYLPNPVILPGGRFLELYYWDTYWIIRGLIHCQMLQSVKGMLQDFLLLLDTYGYVPNGNRIYYSRTQPPFLIQMFKDYVDATGDLTFLENSLPSLEKEFDFWMSNRSVSVSSTEPNGTVQNYTLFRYINEVTGPRPESYSREYVLAETLESTQQRDDFYMNMKSGAESGWDFSSRWFPLNDSANSSLLATKTSQVIPVDLNSIIYKNAKILVDFNNLLNNTAAAQKYEETAEEIKSAINSLLWDEAAGVWFDYDLQEHVRRKQFYPSNIFPLWAGIGCNDSSIVQRVLDYIQDSQVLNWEGGIPTSLVNSSQQWDFPNAWPPLQHLFVESLDNSGYEPAKVVAFDIAQKWVSNNYLTYKRYNNTMFEKYRADLPGEPGGGGLYDVVVGFGWTNGVIIDFLQKYGQRLSSFYNDLRFIL